jgi:hypothetical protein
MKQSKLMRVATAFLFIMALISCDLLDGKSSANQILAFSFPIHGASLEIIDVDAQTVRITVPAGTDLTALVPTIIVSEYATVSPESGVANNFTNSVDYTVTAEDGSRASYLVMVTREGSGGETGGEDGEDTEFLLYVFGKDSWTPFAGKTGVTFTNSNNDVLTVTDNGTKVEFTGKAVGESTITAKFENQTLKAVVKVRATETEEGKKYITYNQPVTAYYMEYTEDDEDMFVAYENKEYCYSFQDFYKYIGSEEIEYTWTGNNTWYKHTGDPEHEGSWLSKEYKEYEYPLGNFAAYVSYYKGTTTFYKYGLSLSDIVASDDIVAPVNTDVTQFYLRSEKVMDIMCDVYKDSQTGSGGTETWTWWVDPATGFTLKYERIDRDGDTESYTVTKLVVGKPDWDGKHLRPKTSDTIVNVD